MQPGLLGRHEVMVMRDGGSTGCTIRKSLVDRDQYTGRYVHCKMMNSSVEVLPEARVYLQSSFYTGWVTAAAMEQPICDFIIGNIPGVRNFVSADIATQTSAAAVTRGMKRKPPRSVPLQVPSVTELANSREVKDLQQSDPSLTGVRRALENGEERNT